MPFRLSLTLSPLLWLEISRIMLVVGDCVQQKLLEKLLTQQVTFPCMFCFEVIRGARRMSLYRIGRI